MNIGMISTRLAGHDGVSLEAAKLVTVLQRMGHSVFYCAGELDPNGPPGMLVPEMHFETTENQWIRQHAYGRTVAPPQLRERIERLRATLRPHIEAFIARYHLDVLIAQNVFAIPIQIPLALALMDVIAATHIPTLAHNHDYYWEREIYRTNCVQDILDTAFPPNLPSITQVAINTLAIRELQQRRGIPSVLLPNVFDFETPAPTLDAYNADFRQAIGLSEEDYLILQPVRIIRRKGLELAIELVARLNDPRCKMVFTHHEDADATYLQELQAQAERLGVEMHIVSDRIAPQRGERDGHKLYTLWDAYIHADFVMYPSLYEGFGNALLETIYFKKPALVNRYAVYTTDIGPLGFEFVEIDGRVTDEAVAQVRALLQDPQRVRRMVEHNYALALKHFSYAALERALRAFLPTA